MPRAGFESSKRNLLTSVPLAISPRLSHTAGDWEVRKQLEFQNPHSAKKSSPYHLLIIKAIYFSELLIIIKLFVVQHKPTGTKPIQGGKKEKLLNILLQLLKLTIQKLEMPSVTAKINNNQLAKQPCSGKVFEQQNVIIYWMLKYVLGDSICLPQ